MSPADDEDTAEDGPPKTEGPPAEPVLAPEDLEFTHHEAVAELEDGKFVIGTAGPPNPEAVERAVRDDDASGDAERDDDSDSGAGGRGSSSQDRDRSTFDELTGREVKQWVTEELERTDSQYAYRIAAKTGENISHQHLASDDISMAFDALLMWYAQQVGGDTPVEEALGILLAKSNVRVRYPLAPLAAYLKQHDLEPGDDIADLLQAVRDDDGLVFPKEP